MGKLRILLFSLLFIPVAGFSAGGNFNLAAQLLAAAKNGDTRQIQNLINSGADVNYVDNTGLSIVCTAIMNNDTSAAQILQMYGADASKCDRQIKAYNKKLPKVEAGGVLSGLSSPQSIALTVAGGAAVVGGLFFLTDVLGSSNNNGGVSSSGDRTNNNTDTPTTATAALTIPYGPAMTNATSETGNYTSNLNLFSPSTASILKSNFELMTETYGQNYLLIMHGYSTLARGYLGMRTVRNSAYEPISLSGNQIGSVNVLGARPVNVTLISGNGINAVADTSLEDTLLPWTTLNSNGTTVSGASNDLISSKYYNNKITRGADNNSLNDDSTSEDSSILNTFDLAGYGTVINNSFAAALDNLIAKVITGRTSGYSTADYFGFMPNGQLTAFRTGNGFGMLAAVTSLTGTLTDNGTTGFNTGDIINLYGYNLTVTNDSDTDVFSATDGTNTYNGYIGADGLFYIDSDDDDEVDQGFTLSSGSFTLAKELGTIDYLNYKALLRAGALWYAGDLEGGKSKPDVIANASVISELNAVNTKTISDILAYSDPDDWQLGFITLVNSYYDRNTTDGTSGANALPGTDAASFFLGLGSSWSPLVIFSTGAFETDSSYSGSTLEATFENSAPLVFDNLEHLFISVVAVGDSGTTVDADSVSGYSTEGKIVLSQWTDTMGTTATTDDKYYKSRICGIGGTGANTIDPWCFAAAGVTDELAVSAMAGAAGALKSAFSYMNNKQIFALLALTADGPYLGTKSTGASYTEAELISYLKSMYQMPAEYQYKWEYGGKDYLDVFKEVFGYGLINLERATTPTKKIYYYDGTNIVSDSGNAYWRSASNTLFRTSSYLSLSASSISASSYDILESLDESLTLPRIWENEFSINSGNYGLYMGDVLGEFDVVTDNYTEFKQGNLGIKMAFSEKQYDDNMGGLDNLTLNYGSGSINLSAGYQNYFTDGANRFNATANPIFSMSSNTVFSDVKYNVNKNVIFGFRGFSGSITDENLLENDPVLTNQYKPATLGFIQGGESNVNLGNKKISLNSAIGFAHETDTLLGAQTTGVLALGSGDTTYIDTGLKFKPADNINISLRSTFAETKSDETGILILGLSNVIKSNAFSVNADIDKLSFTAAMPLAITSGDILYANADYEIIEDEDGNYDLATKTSVDNLTLVPEKREIRFTGSYREKLGEFTDGAIGFIYRVNPNNTDEYGNESIFMLKVSHRLGI